MHRLVKGVLRTTATRLRVAAAPGNLSSGILSAMPTRGTRNDSSSSGSEAAFVMPLGRAMSVARSLPTYRRGRLATNASSYVDEDGEVSLPSELESTHADEIVAKARPVPPRLRIRPARREDESGPPGSISNGWKTIRVPRYTREDLQGSLIFRELEHVLRSIEDLVAQFYTASRRRFMKTKFFGVSGDVFSKERFDRLDRINQDPRFAELMDRLVKIMTEVRKTDCSAWGDYEYNLVVRAYARFNSAQFLEQMLQLVVARKLSLSRKTLTAMGEAFIRAQHHVGAEAALSEILKFGYPRTDHIWIQTMTCCQRAGDFERLERVFDRMLQCDHYPPHAYRDAYSLYCAALIERDDWNQVIHVMREFCDQFPQYSAADVLLSSIAVRRRSPEQQRKTATFLLERMSRMPGLHVASLLMRTCVNTNDLDMCIYFYNNHVNPREAEANDVDAEATWKIHALMIKFLCASGHGRTAFELWSQITSIIVSPTDQDYWPIIDIRPDGSLSVRPRESAEPSNQRALQLEDSQPTHSETPPEGKFEPILQTNEELEMYAAETAAAITEKVNARDLIRGTIDELVYANIEASGMQVSPTNSVQDRAEHSSSASNDAPTPPPFRSRKVRPINREVQDSDAAAKDQEALAAMEAKIKASKHTDQTPLIPIPQVCKRPDDKYFLHFWACALAEIADAFRRTSLTEAVSLLIHYGAAGQHGVQQILIGFDPILSGREILLNQAVPNGAETPCREYVKLPVHYVQGYRVTIIECAKYSHYEELYTLWKPLYQAAFPYTHQNIEMSNEPKYYSYVARFVVVKLVEDVSLTRQLAQAFAAVGAVEDYRLIWDLYYELYVRRSTMFDEDSGFIRKTSPTPQTTMPYAESIPGQALSSYNLNQPAPSALRVMVPYPFIFGHKVPSRKPLDVALGFRPILEQIPGLAELKDLAPRSLLFDLFISHTFVGDTRFPPAELLVQNVNLCTERSTHPATRLIIDLRNRMEACALMGCHGRIVEFFINTLERPAWADLVRSVKEVVITKSKHNRTSPEELFRRHHLSLLSQWAFFFLQEKPGLSIRLVNAITLTGLLPVLSYTQVPDLTSGSTQLKQRATFDVSQWWVCGARWAVYVSIFRLNGEFKDEDLDDHVVVITRANVPRTTKEIDFPSRVEQTDDANSDDLNSLTAIKDPEYANVLYGSLQFPTPTGSRNLVLQSLVDYLQSLGIRCEINSSLLPPGCEGFVMSTKDAIQFARTKREQDRLVELEKERHREGRKMKSKGANPQQERSTADRESTGGTPVPGTSAAPRS